MAGNNYTPGVLEIAKGNIDFVNDTIKVLIVNENYAFDKSHQFVSDVVANEVTNDTGTGYERKTLTGKSVASATGTPDEIRFDADNLVYSVINLGAEEMAAAIIYKEVTDDSDSIILSMADQPNVKTIGTDVRIEWPDQGVMYTENPIS